MPVVPVMYSILLLIHSSVLYVYSVCIQCMYTYVLAGVESACMLQVALYVSALYGC